MNRVCNGTISSWNEIDAYLNKFEAGFLDLIGQEPETTLVPIIKLRSRGEEHLRRGTQSAVTLPKLGELRTTKKSRLL